jgi:thioester reductase-like protein
MPRSVFVTGATGMFGRELVRHLLTETPFDLNLLIHREGVSQSRGRMLRDVFRMESAGGLEKRLHLVEGDVTRERFGLRLDAYRRLTRDVDSVLHAAAATRFDLPLAAARAVNVGGTRNVIRFASDCRNLDRFGLVSTVYVSGRRSGCILERELQHDAGFVNTYERSKNEAEALVAAGSSPPWAVYRLSTLLGDSETGWTSRITAAHQALHVMHLGLASVIPGDPECRVDLAPTDLVAAAVGVLFAERFTPGQTFHVVAGDERSLSLADLIQASYGILSSLDPAWATRHFPLPVIGSERAFALLVRSAEQAHNPLLARLYSGLLTYAAQFGYPKSFDATNLRGVLPDFQSELPDTREFLARVLRYCLDTRWVAR